MLARAIRIFSSRLCRRLVQLLKLFLQRPRLIHHCGSIQAGLLQRAYPLAQLIPSRLQLF